MCVNAQRFDIERVCGPLSEIHNLPDVPCYNTFFAWWDWEWEDGIRLTHCLVIIIIDNDLPGNITERADYLILCIRYLTSVLHVRNCLSSGCTDNGVVSYQLFSLSIMITTDSIYNLFPCLVVMATLRQTNQWTVTTGSSQNCLVQGTERQTVT